MNPSVLVLDDLRGFTFIRPMGAAIVHGSKRIENRPQNLPTKMRGRPTVVAVHSGGGWDDQYLQTVLALDGDHDTLSYDARLRDTGIVGLMVLSGHVFTDPRPRRWYGGPYGYEVADAIAFATPIPCRGMMGFWRVPRAIATSEQVIQAFEKLCARSVA